MACNGKCHLSKELKKANEEESGKKQNQNKRNSVEEFSSEIIILNISPTEFIIKENYPSISISTLNLSAEINPPPPKA